jgi:TubC N-terminal docking domain
MTVRTLFENLRQRGLQLAVDGVNIRVRGPRGAMTSEVLEAIRQQKPGLLAELMKPSTAAKDLLDQLLDEGSTFRVVRRQGKDLLVWFGPASTVAANTRAEVAAHQSEIVGLLRAGHPRSRRTWGEPTDCDWLRHPDLTAPDTGQAAA